MRISFLIYISFFSFQLFSQGTWTARSNYPGQVVMTGVGFSIGNKGYMGTGMGPTGISYNEFYEYDPGTDTWTLKTSLPGMTRHFAVGFSIGSKGYMGTGLNSPTYFNDFWEYDPALDSWTQRANVPGPARATAMAFSCLGKGYVGAGAGGTALQDLWEFDPAINSWTQKANYPGLRMDMERPFVIGTKLYSGNGWNGPYYNDFWEYDVVNDVWTQKANFGGSARFGCTGFAICNFGYMGFGQDLSSPQNSDLWRYDPANNNWTQVASLPSEVVDAPVFVIGDKAYLGPGGVNAPEFWEYTPDPCDGEGMNDGNGNQISVSVYPNPSKGLFTVECKLTKGEIVIYDYSNTKIVSEKISATKTEIDLTDFPKGIYFLKITSGKISVTKKIIVQ